MLHTVSCGQQLLAGSIAINPLDDAVDAGDAAAPAMPDVENMILFGE